MLSRTNPGVQHIRKLYLQLERIPKSQDSDDDDSGSSSDEEIGPQYEEPKVAARHGKRPFFGERGGVQLMKQSAQFTVRLLIDFLPKDILEVFRYAHIQ